MKIIMFFLVFLFVTQISTAQELTFGDRALKVSIAAGVFTLVDYITFNLVKSNPNAIRAYRIAQLTTQVLLTYWLWDTGDWKCAIAFNLMLWTWNYDWAYYGVAHVVNPASPWENRTNNGLHNDVRHAWWTPVGLIAGYDGREPLGKDVLAAQSMMGLTISFMVLL